MINLNSSLCLLVTLVTAAAAGCSARGQNAMSAAGKNSSQPTAKEKFNLANADACELLREAREAYLADVSGDDANKRTLMYIWQRENISHSPLLHIALDLADRDDEQAVDTANAIDKADLRAFTLVGVAKAQHQRGHKEDAAKTLQAAIDLLKSKDVDSQSADAIWPHVVSALLWMHGDIDSAKDAAEVAGCPWDAMDTDERQFQLARYHLSTGELDKARQDLLALPASALAGQKAQQALAGDDGAAFYAWSARSVSEPNAYTANHVLLEWLGNGGKPDEIAAILRNLEDTDVCKIDGYLKLTKRYKKAGDADKAAEAFKQAEKLVELIRDGDRLDRMRIYLAIQRPQTDGISMSEAVKESGVLEKHRGEPWLAGLILPLLDAGELPLAEQIAAAGKMNDYFRGHFAIALTKAGKLAEAQAQVNQATEPLGAAKILLAIAMQQKENGDASGAGKTIFDAIARAKKVPETNSWFPDKGQVRLQDKWHLMTWLDQVAIELGYGDRVIQEFDDDASIRQLASTFGARNESDLVDKWLGKFDDRARQEGARCLALLGLAEGLTKRAK